MNCGVVLILISRLEAERQQRGPEFGPVPLDDLDLSVCYSTMFDGT
jgi:hypothetical protein